MTLHDEKKHYKYLIFSFSSVLCQARPQREEGKTIQISLIQKAYEIAYPDLKPREKQITDKMIEGKSIFQIFKALNSVQADELYTKYKELLEENNIKRLELTPGSESLLKQLKQFGIKVILLDFKHPSIVRKALNALGIDSYVEKVVDTQQSGELRKGRPEVFHHLIQRDYPDMTQFNTAVVGYQNADLNFAQSVGLDSFWLQNAGGDFNMCAHLAEENGKTVQDLSDLLKMIGYQPSNTEEAHLGHLTNRP
jgi:phosphoglycolate phosphatase-like HAD superfamily hydrolase